MSLNKFYIHVDKNIHSLDDIWTLWSGTRILVKMIRTAWVSNHCLSAYWSDKYHTGMTCWKLSTIGTYFNGTWNYFQYLWDAKVTWSLKLLSMIFTYLSCFEVWFVTWSHRYKGRHFFRSIYSNLIYLVSYFHFAFCPSWVSCSWILLNPWKVYWYQS